MNSLLQIPLLVYADVLHLKLPLSQTTSFLHSHSFSQHTGPGDMNMLSCGALLIPGITTYVE